MLIIQHLVGANNLLSFSAVIRKPFETRSSIRLEKKSRFLKKLRLKVSADFASIGISS